MVFLAEIQCYTITYLIKQYDAQQDSGAQKSWGITADSSRKPSESCSSFVMVMNGRLCPPLSSFRQRATDLNLIKPTCDYDYCDFSLCVLSNFLSLLEFCFSPVFHCFVHLLMSSCFQASLVCLADVNVKKKQLCCGLISSVILLVHTANRQSLKLFRLFHFDSSFEWHAPKLWC